MSNTSHTTPRSDAPDDTTPEGLFEAAFDTLPLSAAIIDADGAIVATNRAWCDFALDNGGDPDAQLGENYLRVCKGADAEAEVVAAQLQDIIARRRQSLELEYPCHSPERRRWYVMRASGVELGGERFVLVCHADITARRLAEEEALRRAAEDPLTGLLNRRSFRERLAQALNQAQRRGRPLAVLFLDLNGFKAVNDQWGHAAGDRVLRTVAECLRQSLRRVDSVSRLGGDEFAMFLEDAQEQDVLNVAERIARLLSDEVVVKDQCVALGASLGASFYPRDGEDVQSLLHAADAAMYVAKTKGLRVSMAGDGFIMPSPSGD